MRFPEPEDLDLQDGPEMTSPQRFRFAAILTVFVILALVFTTCISCVHHINASSVHEGRSPVDAHNSAVRIVVNCNGKVFGSTGVMTNSYTVLTAAHAVYCQPIEGIDLWIVPTSITLDAGDGRVLEGEVDWESWPFEHDIARVRLKDGQKFSTGLDTPVQMGSTPKVGQTACTATALPMWSYRCGLVQPSSDPTLIRTEFLTEHGNSGSGLYVNGKLVGIVIRLYSCEWGPCGDIARNITDKPWLLD